MKTLEKIARRGTSLVLGKLVRPLGLAVVSVESSRPGAWGVNPILGSFPPLSGVRSIGSLKNYFIHDGYQHREHAIYFDDTLNTDESQLEVYQFAKEICEREGLSTVFDIGCGSGFKLMKFLGAMKTVGIDVSQTCQWLRRKYPDRVWEEFDSLSKPRGPVDLVIAADVIEHLEEPDSLLTMIEDMRPRFIILSTPDRDLLRMGTHNGPPANPAHIREWSFLEFGAYIGNRFELLEQFISCTPQATQCVLCRPHGMGVAPNRIGSRRDL